MPKVVVFDGAQHNFPDDFTDADISAALGSTSASGPIDYTQPPPPGHKVTLSDVGQAMWANLKKKAGGVVESIKTLPQRAGEAAIERSQGGDYNPAPFMEAATLASPVNPALRAGDKIIPGVAKAFRAEEKATPTANELATAGGTNFERARTSGVEVNPQSVKDWSHTVQRDLEEAGRIDAPKVAPGTHDLLRRLQNIPAPEAGMPPATQTISNLHALRRSFQAIAQDVSPANKSDRAAASIAIQKLDEFLGSLAPQDIVAGSVAAPYAIEQWQKGSGNYAAAQRSNKLTGELDDAYTGILDRGELRAGVANSGQNVGNSIRQRIASLLSNRKELQGFNPEEIAALERGATGTTGMNASRYVANVLGGGGGLGAQITGALGGGVGAAVGGIPGAAVGASLGPVVGASAKALEGNLTKRAVRSADELVRQRSPLYKDTPAEMTAISPEKRAAALRAIAEMLNAQQGQR